MRKCLSIRARRASGVSDLKQVFRSRCASRSKRVRDALLVVGMLARGVLVWMVMLAFTTSLHAEPEEPWRVGVTDDQMARAKQVLDEATELFVAHRYPEALERFRAALAIWDHPALRFDIVRCLIQLDRPLEAADNLEHALAYGKAALPGTTYEQALEFQKLLANQIGVLAVHCREPEVAIRLDGRELGRCPLEQTIRVAPGDHFVVGSKRGFLTETRTAEVFGGKRAEVTISPVPLAKAAIEVRQWHAAIPWSVLGAGLAVAGVGGLLRLQATDDMAAYDTAIRLDCRTTGCSPTMVDRELNVRARHENEAAIGIASVGAAAAVVGGVLLYLNRAHTIYPTVEGNAVGVRGAF